MRGVLSLAAALALPVVLTDGSPFPQRDLIVFLTFCVICVTLVLQGVTLAPLIRALGLAGAAGPNCEELEARRIVIEAALSHLNDAKAKDREESAALYEDLTRHYHQRLASLQPGGGNQGDIADPERPSAILSWRHFVSSVGQQSVSVMRAVSTMRSCVVSNASWI